MQCVKSVIGGQSRMTRRSTLVATDVVIDGNIWNHPVSHPPQKKKQTAIADLLQKVV